MEKTNNSRITPANYIAIFAMAFLALFTFFGWMYGSEDGEAGVAVIMTLLEVLLLGSFLILSIKAKSATSHFGMWRIVKWASLVAYVIVAVLFSTPLLKYFYIMSEKDSLQETAKNEIAAVESLYTQYDHTMDTATKQAIEQMNNYVNSKSHSFTMESYMDSMSIVRSDIASWGKEVRDTWRLKKDNSLTEMRKQILSWGVLDLNIAQVGKRIKNKGQETLERINKKIKSNIDAKIVPVIRYTNGQYVTDSFVEPVFESPSTGEFHKKLRDSNHATFLGWFFFVLLHLLILFNYVVTRNNDIVGPGKNKNSNTNGVDL